jgi:heme A synthase
VSRGPASEKTGRAAFRIVALVALVAAVGQVSLGGVVRVTGSGLGCPDWPLCHGQVLPPLELTTLIEYSHRLSATALGVLVLATAVMAWRTSRDDLRVTVSSTMAMALVVVAAVLGGITVWAELAWWVVLLHLGIAEFVVACMVVTAAASWKVRQGPRVVEVGDSTSSWFGLLVIGGVVGGFALIMSGSYMVGQGYGSACAAWPLCGGSLLPEGGATLVHMAHRFVAALLAVLVAATVITAWSRRARSPHVLWASLLAAALLVAQVLVGAATVWTGFSVPLKSIHLSVATMLWAALVFFATLQFLPHRLPLKSSAHSPGWVTRPGKVAP